MYYIGLDIGGTKCAVCIGEVKDGVLTLIDKEKFATGKGRDPYEVLAELYTHSVSVLETHGMSFSDIAGIGISCGGPLDASRGVILSPPNLPGWDHIEIVKYFEEKTGVKTYLQNDANACAVAEWKFGAGRDPETGKCVDNMIFCTFGTGLGAGLILNGRLYSGTSDMAGEVGHIRLAPDGPVGYGKAGSFEGFCSGGGIAEMSKQMLSIYNGMTSIPRDNVTAKTVAQEAEKGDKLAGAIYRRCAEKLGMALSVLIDILNPEKIVIGSIYERSGHLLESTMREVIEREALSLSAQVCEIVPAMLGDSIGDYAAIGVAADFAKEIERE